LCRRRGFEAADNAGESDAGEGGAGEAEVGDSDVDEELVDDRPVVVDVADVADIREVLLRQRGFPSDHGGVSWTGGQVRIGCQARVRH